MRRSWRDVPVAELQPGMVVAEPLGDDESGESIMQCYRITEVTQEIDRGPDGTCDPLVIVRYPGRHVTTGELVPLFRCGGQIALVVDEPDETLATPRPSGSTRP